MSIKKLAIGLVSTAFISSVQASPVINEIIYNAGGDAAYGGATDANREFVEIKGTPGASLDNVFYLTINGDHSGNGKGWVETVVDLTGNSLGSNGLFLIRGSQIVSMSADTNELEYNFEVGNGTNTFMLVEGYTGNLETDIDPDDDDSNWDPNGPFSQPWSSIYDALSIEERSGTSEADSYGEDMGFISYSKAGDDIGYDPDGFIRIAGLPSGTGIVVVSNGLDAAGGEGQEIIGMHTDGTPNAYSAFLSDRTLTDEFNGQRFTPGADNISAIPVPAAAWLLGSALLGLAGIKRTKK